VSCRGLQSGCLSRSWPIVGSASWTLSAALLGCRDRRAAAIDAQRERVGDDHRRRYLNRPRDRSIGLAWFRSVDDCRFGYSYNMARRREIGEKVPSMKDGTDRTIRLRDGRRMGYAEWGDGGGRPLLYFHGWPGSRVEGRLADETAMSRSIKLIAIDRPGMGLSDFQRGRTLVDWPDDVLELAAALGLDRFAVCWGSRAGPRTPPHAPGSSQIG
jgi:hypothetical protein